MVLIEMNIKGVINSLIPVDFLKRTDARKRAAQTATDRDPQSGQGDSGPPERHKFTDEEIEEALKVLQGLPGVNKNNLFFKVERVDDRVIVFVQDHTGKTIRRIADTELWSILKSRGNQSPRGNLLNKAL